MGAGGSLGRPPGELGKPRADPRARGAGSYDVVAGVVAATPTRRSPTLRGSPPVGRKIIATVPAAGGTESAPNR